MFWGSFWNQEPFLKGGIYRASVGNKMMSQGLVTGSFFKGYSIARFQNKTNAYKYFFINHAIYALKNALSV